MTPRSRSQFTCTVRWNQLLCREHYRLVLAAAAFPPTEPGQFLQVACNDLHSDVERELDWLTRRSSEHQIELMDRTAFLRRPFSLAGRRDTTDGVELELIHRVVGAGTSWLAQLQPNDQVGVLGPLGNAFALPPAGATALLVAGGVGIPPMLYLATRLRGRAVAFCGATTRDLLPLTLTATSSNATPQPIVEEFARHDIPSVITTDDGSFGVGGFVTHAMESYLDANPSGRFVIYTCGPEPMMKRVADIAISRGIPCQVAVERAMACGMGTCQSCCIRVRKPDKSQPPLAGQDWCYRLACTDGPVFEAADLLW
jgi:dihydroorotate dehydrogenase electron transfer subunit